MDNIGLHKIADIDDDLGRAREADLSPGHLGKHLGKYRNDPDHQHRDHNHRHAQDGRGIDHRSFDLGLEFHGLLDVLGQATQNGVQQASDLPGMDHVDVELIKHFRVLLQRVGERGAPFHLNPDFSDGFP